MLLLHAKTTRNVALLWENARATGYRDGALEELACAGFARPRMVSCAAGNHRRNRPGPVRLLPSRIRVDNDRFRESSDNPRGACRALRRILSASRARCGIEIVTHRVSVCYPIAVTRLLEPGRGGCHEVSQLRGDTRIQRDDELVGMPVLRFHIRTQRERSCVGEWGACGRACAGGL